MAAGGQAATSSLGDTEALDTGQDFFPQESLFTALHDDFFHMDASTLDSIWYTEDGPESASPEDTTLSSVQQVHRLWHCRIPDTPANEMYYAGYAIEPVYGPVAQPRASLPDVSDIDDHYRQGLENSLRISSREPAIPSVDFINVCVRLYFAKVHPLFPIIHRPTFRPSKSNAALLLSICAIGCLFTGSAQGFQHGVELFERNHKTILLKWERLTAKSRDVMPSIIQSCLLSHLFGMLSGSPMLLLNADAFHGLPISWARHLSLHRRESPRPVDLSLEGPELEDAWRDWARDEELLRINHGLYLVDAELSNMTHREPFQPFESYRFPSSASEPAFMARTAHEWKAKMRSTVHLRDDGSAVSTGSKGPLTTCSELEKFPIDSSLTANVVLQAMGIMVLSERVKTTLNESALPMVSKSLTSFYHKFLAGNHGLHYGQLQLPVLWHATQMTVLADLDLLEKAIGRDGRCLTQAEEAALDNWTSSEESRVCVKHALMIHRRMEHTRAGCEPALHVPRALFWAGLVVSCHIRAGTYDDADLAARSSSSHQDADGTSELGLAELHATVIDGSLLKMTMFALADMLRTLGHWGLARRFADILTILATK